MSIGRRLLDEIRELKDERTRLAAHLGEINRDQATTTTRITEINDVLKDLATKLGVRPSDLVGDEAVPLARPTDSRPMSRNASSPQPRNFEDLSENEQRVAVALSQGELSPKQVAVATTINHLTVYDILARMQSWAMVTRTGRYRNTRYQLAAAMTIPSPT